MRYIEPYAPRFDNTRSFYVKHVFYFLYFSGSKDALSAKIKKIQKKNDEILKRRKEVEQDKKKYGQ